MDNQYTILFVDDEPNILHSVKRLLRKEGYRLLTAQSAKEGLAVLQENEIHLVISDQRMPEMSGTEFFAQVKTRYPDVIRVILSGYTDVDSITESINKGHIYKFLLKPWNDQNLKLEIKHALEQYDLIQANKRLHAKVVDQNEELKKINEHLEDLVQERTRRLEIQNQALELSHAILEDIPVPIIGVSAEQMIVFINREMQSLSDGSKRIEIGGKLSDCFSDDVTAKMIDALSSNTSIMIKGYRLSDTSYVIDLIPLAGRFSGKGVILTLKALPGPYSSLDK